MHLKASDIHRLEQDHSTEAIQERLALGAEHSYLRDMVYGAVDGAVTTFAVVSGVAGAGLSVAVVLILGFANLLGDGFSMAAGNYLATKVDKRRLLKMRSIEETHIREVPEGEREEVRQIFKAKGFEGDILEKIVQTITADEELWVDTMLREEWGLSLHVPSPWRAGLSTFGAFAAAGLVPLIPFVINFIFKLQLDAFIWSSIFTATVFFLVGALKSSFTGEKWLRSGFETLLVGGSAATLAYLVGILLKNITA